MEKTSRKILMVLILGLIMGLGSANSFANNGVDHRAWALYMTAADSAVEPEIDKEATRAFSLYLTSTDHWK